TWLSGGWSSDVCPSGLEDFLDFLADVSFGAGGLNGRTAVGEAFVEVLFEAEPVAIAFYRQIVRGFAEGFEGSFHVSDVQPGFGRSEGRGLGKGYGMRGM